MTDFERFRAWKLTSIRRDILKARMANWKGNHKAAVWYLHLASLSRGALLAS